MGFSISWVAFHGLSKGQVLTRLGFRDVGHDCAADGQPKSSVWHDLQKTVWDISTTGKPPAELTAINERLFAKQAQACGARSAVDYVIYFPIELAFAVTDYRHDHVAFDWGLPKFTAIERVRCTRRKFESMKATAESMPASPPRDAGILGCAVA
jgi:hypothetical protein